MRALPARGFTLAEMLVGLAVTSIILVSVTAVVIAVQNTYQQETESKLLTENGRTALLNLERIVPMAGYGIDPRIAFDVSTSVPGGLVRDNLEVSTATFNPPQPLIDGGVVVTDDLAFRFRDPAWLHTGHLTSESAAIGGGDLVLDLPTTVAIPEGKLLLVVCRGAQIIAAVRTDAPVPVGASSVPVVSAGVSWGNRSEACLTAVAGSSPQVFMVQEHRLRIVNLDGRPWLVSFRNLDHDTRELTNDSFDPIAADVENFQVAFAVNRAPPGLSCCQVAPDPGGDWLYGNTLVGAAPEAVFAQQLTPLASLPDFSTSYADPLRFTGTAANVRAVHIGLTLRSPRKDPTGRRATTVETLFNWEAPVRPPDGFTRTTFHGVMNVPNMLSRSFFLPSLRSSSDLRDLNSWGG